MRDFRGLRVVLRQLAVTAALGLAVFELLMGLGLAPHLAALGVWLQTSLPSNDTPNLPAAPPPAAAPPPESMLVLPPCLYGVVGHSMRLVYDSIAEATPTASYHFAISSDASGAFNRQPRWWSVQPRLSGSFSLHATVSESGRVLEGTSCSLRVAAAEAGAKRTLQLLIAGDSTTWLTTWVNELAVLLSAPSNPTWHMLGEQPIDMLGPLPGVKHEGLRGWSLIRLAEDYSPGHSVSGLKDRSPFVYGNVHGHQLDFARYYRENNSGVPADVFIIQIGFNDVMGGPLSPPLEIQLKRSVESAEALIAAAHQAHPQTAVALLLPLPPATEQAFRISYHQVYKKQGIGFNPHMRDQILRGQRGLVRAFIGHFAHREKEGVWLIPVHASFDAVEGYRNDDPFHPNVAGSRCMAECTYAWLKCWLAESKT